MSRPLRSLFVHWPALAALLAALLAAPSLPAQATLREVLEAARTSSYPTRIARGALEAARGQAEMPLAGILPSAALDLGAMRTTDPIAAFGTRLRQRAVTPAAFDPALLNFPAAITNYNVGLQLQAPVLNADAWAGRAAAGAASTAAGATAAWTETEAELDALKAWYGAVMADELVRSLDAARAAASAHVAQAAAMRNAGTATKADLLLAELRVGELDMRHAQAQADAAMARRALALRVGGRHTTFALPAALPPSERIRPWLAAPTDRRVRGDLTAAAAASRAAQLDLRRTAAAVLPRVNGFARWDWNSALRPWAGQENWTAGVMLSLPIFHAGTHLADRQQAYGRWRQAESGRDAAAARADLERAQALAAARVAEQRLELAARAVGQADEAHRLVARRYEGGLATIAELLAAHAAQTEAGLGAAMARGQAIAAAADLRRTHGLDVRALLALETPTAPAVAAP
jgi:outer membrane protein TolC